MFYSYFPTTLHLSQPRYEIVQEQIRIVNYSCTNLREQSQSLIRKVALLNKEIVSLEIRIRDINQKIDNLTLNQINRDSLASIQQALQKEIYKIQSEIAQLKWDNSTLETQRSIINNLINIQCPSSNLILPSAKPPIIALPEKLLRKK
jgi:predicted  nucleic acid-binding Zn-ribbon protein